MTAPNRPCPYEHLHPHMHMCNLCGYMGRTMDTMDDEMARLTRWAQAEHPDWFK